MLYNDAWKVSVFRVFLVCILQHSGWITTRKTLNTETFHAMAMMLFCTQKYITVFSVIDVWQAQRRKCSYLELFWSPFFRIFWYLDWIRRDTPYLSVFSSNAGKWGKMWTRITTNSDTFYAVKIINKLLDLPEKARFV